MDFFQSIILNNYRNFKSFEIGFNLGCNVIIGRNGSGKTNILESISLFQKGRGIRKDNIKNFINIDDIEKNFFISSLYSNNNNLIQLSLSCERKNSNFKKNISVNDSNETETVKHFQNLFSLIYFLPEMERIFLNSPSFRRNFFDRLIYNIDKNYNTLVNSYKKNILERHNILKNHRYDIEWIKIIEKKIVDLAFKIYNKRLDNIVIINSNLEKLENFQNKLYRISFRLVDDLLDNKQEISDNFYEKYLIKLEETREIDSFLGGCKYGPHKSDINGFNLENNFNINQFSTGQQKAILLLVIIAHCNYLINKVNVSPIILFDEVCSHLDDENRKLLLKMIEALKIQIFMTGTDKKLFSFLSTNVFYCNIV